MSKISSKSVKIKLCRKIKWVNYQKSWENGINTIIKYGRWTKNMFPNNGNGKDNSRFIMNEQ